MKRMKDQFLAAEDLAAQKELEEMIREAERQQVPDASVSVPIDKLYRLGLLPGSVVKNNNAGDVLKLFNLSVKEYEDHVTAIMKNNNVPMMKAHEWFLGRMKALTEVHMRRGLSQQEAVKKAKLNHHTLRM